MTCAVITALKLREKKFSNICESLIRGQHVAVTFEILLKNEVLEAYTKFFGKDILRKFRYSLASEQRIVSIDKTYLVGGFHQSYGTSHVKFVLDIKFVSLNCFFAHGKSIGDIF